MLTALLILAVVAVVALFAGFVCVMFTDGGFFGWLVVVPEVGKGIGYIVAALCCLISEVNSN